MLRNPDPQLKDVSRRMSNTLARTHDQLPGSDRRSSMRQPIPSLAYVELDEGNGGIILNISEGGLSVQAVTSLMDDFLPGVRFQLSETESWIEANARITWTSQSRKLAGLEFIGLSEESRGRIRDWLNRDSLTAAAAGGAPNSTAPETTAEPPATSEVAASFTQPFEPMVASQFPAPAEAPAEEVAEPEPEPGEPKVEEASHALADLLTSVSDHARATAPAPSVLPAAEAEAKKSFNIERLIEKHWSVVTALLLLALVSLVAGWVAGQGALGRYLAKIRLIPSRNFVDSRSASPANPARGVRLTEIEVLSASNQRWTVPFNGPMNAPTDATRHQLSTVTSSATAAPALKPDMGFRTWILTPPSQTRAASDNGGLRDTPPVLLETPNASDNVLTPTGGFSPHAMASTPNLAVPAPPTPAGIVKQGQLIHRVDPIYPVVAKEQHSEGTVRLNVTVGPDGIVRGVALLGGPRLLVDAAEKAVRQWRYAPTLLDGKPVEFQREVDLTFRFAAVR